MVRHETEIKVVDSHCLDIVPEREDNTCLVIFGSQYIFFTSFCRNPPQIAEAAKNQSSYKESPEFKVCDHFREWE